MAYTPKMFKEEDQADGGLAAAPALGESGFGVGGGTPGNVAPGAPQAQSKEGPQAQSVGAGTGFVNLDRVLAANQGIGSKVAESGAAAINKEKDALSDASKNFGSDVAAGSNFTMPTTQLGALSGGNASDADKDAIMAALNAKYTGPTMFNYKTGSGLQQAKALTSAQSTGKQLAENAQGFAGGLASYNPQLAALDRALYGQEASAVEARGQLGKDTKALTNKIGATRDSMAGSVANAQNQAKSVRQSTRDALAQQASGILSGAGDQATAFNADEAARFGTGGAELNPGSWNQAGNRIIGTPQWTPGTQATAGNFIDPTQASTLQFISQALGDPSLAVGASGPAQHGSWAADEVFPTDPMSPSTPTLGVTPGSVRDNAAAQAAEDAARRRQAENMRKAVQGGFRNKRP